MKTAPVGARGPLGGWSRAGLQLVSGEPRAVELSVERVLESWEMEQILDLYSGGPDKIGSFLKLLGLIFLKQGFWFSVDQSESESGIFQVAPHLFLSLKFVTLLQD